MYIVTCAQDLAGISIKSGKPWSWKCPTLTLPRPAWWSWWGSQNIHIIYITIYPVHPEDPYLKFSSILFVALALQSDFALSSNQNCVSYIHINMFNVYLHACVYLSTLDNYLVMFIYVYIYTYWSNIIQTMRGMWHEILHPTQISQGISAIGFAGSICIDIWAKASQYHENKCYYQASGDTFDHWLQHIAT